MNPSSGTVSPVALATRNGRTHIGFGDELVLGPKAGFDVVMDPSDESAARLTQIDEDMASSDTQDLLAAAATRSLERVANMPPSPEAWAQAGFALLASLALADARAAFEKAIALNPHHRSARLGLARTLHQQGASQEALVILDTLMNELPNDLELVVATAVIFASLDRMEDATHLLDRDVKPGPRTALLLAARGSLKTTRGDYKGAISDLRKAIRYKPEWVNVRNVLGIAEFKAGNIKAAEQRFHEAMRIGPMYRETFDNLLRVLLAGGRYLEVQKLTASKFARPNTPATTARIAARAAIKSEEWTEAKAWLEVALAKTKDTSLQAGLRNDIGVAWSRLGNVELALSRFEEAYKMEPALLFALNKAKSYLMRGSAHLAVTWLRSLDPMSIVNSIDFQQVLGSALVQAGMAEDAISVIDPLLRNPDVNPGTFASLSAAYSDGIQQYEQAIDIARRGLSRFPDDLLLHNNLAYALLLAGRVDEARAVLATVPVYTAEEPPFLTATRGLLALSETKIIDGRRWYDIAASHARTESERERIRVKRDLEVGRAIIRTGGSKLEATTLFQAAAGGTNSTRPYNLHASAELKALPEHCEANRTPPK